MTNSNAQLHEIRSCEVCGNDDLQSVLDLGPQPMCDDLIPVSDNRVCDEYPVEILYCARCSTAHQRYQVPKQLLFPKTYHYRSRFTADVLNGMEGLVEACWTRMGSLDGKTVLDVGCNDGSLLNFFGARGARTVGVEPTDAGLEARAKGHRVYVQYFDDDAAAEIVAEHGQPDIITFTNVFAHIEDLGAMLGALKKVMSPTTVLVIENHYLGSVLAGNQFDTFYHEHPRTYSYKSFQYIAKSLGRSLIEAEFPSRYGGNIRVYIGPENYWPQDANEVSRVEATEQDFAEAFAGLRNGIEKWTAAMRRLLADKVGEHGALNAKAFPGRAAILVKLLGVDTETIAAVYEKPGSLKVGHFVPGTRIPILSDDEMPTVVQGTPLINLAWHIPDEIRAYLSARGYRGDVIDVLGDEYFR